MNSEKITEKNAEKIANRPIWIGQISFEIDNKEAQ